MVVSRGDYPQMAASFRLVNYYNLPRYMYLYKHLQVGELTPQPLKNMDMSLDMEV